MKRHTNPKPPGQTERLLKRIRQLEDAIVDTCRRVPARDGCRYEDTPEARLYAVLHSDW